MDKTKISWTQGPDGEQGATWNPTDGCEVCSPGCKNCYAMRIAGRFSGPGKPYEGLVTISKKGKAVWNGVGRLNPKALTKPLHWRRPRGVFVDSMSDLFFEPITNEEIAAVFGVMAAAPQHRYMILTKRARRMREWYEWLASTADINGTLHVEAAPYIADDIGDDDAEYEEDDPAIVAGHRICDAEWPLPQVWQGVSVDDRKHGLPRIDELRRVRAAVRWVSIEPLLEDLGEIDLTGIHWAVLGCESGPGARRCKPEWLRSIIEQCRAQGVKVWLKQAEESYSDDARDRYGFEEHIDDSVEGPITFGPGSELKARIKGGNRVIERPYLDGEQHLEMPNG